MAQGVQLSLHDGEALALGGFLGLRRFVGGCKRLDPLCQVGQLRTLGGFFSLRCLIVGGEGGGLLAQGVQLSLHDVEALALGRFLSLCRCIGGVQRGGLLGQGFDLLRQVG